VRVEVPALRARAGDIPLIVDAFLDDLAEEHGRARPALADEVMGRLAAMPWPGNIRELRNCLETMLLTGGADRIQMGDLPADAQEGGLPASDGLLSMRPIAEVERELIRNTLRDLKGNRARAARALGISTRTLYRRIKELGL